MTKVFFYTHSIPFQSGNGFVMRNFSNLRCYIHLGYDVKCILVTNKKRIDYRGIKDTFPQVDWEILYVDDYKDNSFLHKIAYYVQFPNSHFLKSIFKDRQKIQDNIISKSLKWPNALYHLESINASCASYGLEHLNIIWSNHDNNSERFKKLKIKNNENLSIWKRFIYLIHYNRLKNSESLIAKSCRLVLTINSNEAREYKKRWPNTTVCFLPFSSPIERLISKTRYWMEDGYLTILHLGRLDGFLGFQSLKFIFEKIFPEMNERLLSKIKFKIVGLDNESEKSLYIKKIASKYDNIDFTNYLQNIEPIYAKSDIQIIAPKLATGGRTRIIESLAYGIPVLCSNESADGLNGLVHSENILLASTKQDFIKNLKLIFDSPHILESLSQNGRILYESQYSSQITRSILKQFLKRVFKL